MPSPGLAKMYYGDYEFTPIPLFSWSTEMVRDNKLDDLFLRNTLDFTGTLLQTAPSESGDFPLMMTKREALRDILTASGRHEWRITYNGAHVVSGIYPNVQNINFDQGVWTDRINYGFSFVFDEELDAQTPIQSFTESWSFDENEDRRSVTARHEIGAVGINTNPSGVNNALSNARTFVLGKTGYNNVPLGHPAFVEGSGTLTAYEELRNENADVQAGTFSVIENFTLSSGFYVHTQTGNFELGDDGITTVSLDGNIRGLGRGDIAFDRALSAWNTLKLLLPGNASGVYSDFGGESTLYTTNTQSLSLTKNRYAGSISYGVAYTDDASENLPSGIQDFTLTINDDKPTRLYASFTIMERNLGNVVQDIQTSKEGTFTINGSAVGKQGFPFDELVSYAETRINNVRPLSANYVTLRLDQQTVNKDEDRNTLNFNLSWKYTKELSQASIDGPVNLGL